MPPPIEDRRPPITPQLAVRVAVLGGFAFVLFAVIFFRLWFLQVLTGDDYVVQARENRIRKVKIEAPRGNIVDRDGAHARQDARRAGGPDPAQLGARRRARGGRDVPQAAGGVRRAAAGGGAGPARARARPARGRPPLDARRARRAPRPARPRAARGQGRDRSDRAGRAAAAVALQAARRGDRPDAGDDPPARDPGDRRPALGERDDQDRRLAGRVQLPARAPRGLPRRRGREEVPAPLPVQDARRAAVRHAARDLAGGARAASATAASRRARGSARTGSRRATTSTCAAPTASRA